jgi:hypothetical protein
MKQIQLSGKNGKDKYTLVDDEDYDRYKHLSWYLSDTGYALRAVRYGDRSENKKRRIRLHRLIMNAPESKEVDHINGDKLDNRRKNLRLCTHRENMLNKTKAKGYSFIKRSKKFRVVYRNGIYGEFKEESDAIKTIQLARLGKIEPTRLIVDKRYNTV